MRIKLYLYRLLSFIPYFKRKVMKYQIQDRISKSFNDEIILKEINTVFDNENFSSETDLKIEINELLINCKLLISVLYPDDETYEINLITYPNSIIDNHKEAGKPHRMWSIYRIIGNLEERLKSDNHLQILHLDNLD